MMKRKKTQILLTAILFTGVLLQGYSAQSQDLSITSPDSLLSMGSLSFGAGPELTLRITPDFGNLSQGSVFGELTLLTLNAEGGYSHSKYFFILTRLLNGELHASFDELEELGRGISSYIISYDVTETYLTMSFGTRSTSNIIGIEGYYLAKSSHQDITVTIR